MRGRSRTTAAGALAAALVLLAGCSGRTTSAGNLTSTTATLNAVGSCDASCTAHMRWRQVGATTWTNTASFTVGRVHNVVWSRNVSGLAPGTSYEYQACGKENSWSQAVCVGPDGTPDTRGTFATPPGEVVFDRPGVHTFSVPPGVSRATFELAGAQGGRGWRFDLEGMSRPDVPGGLGARLRRTLTVQPGATLTVVVGGRGGDAQEGGSGGGGGAGGGGVGGDGSPLAGAGGGGGGATDVRTGAGDTGGLTGRLLTAAGGGGGGAAGSAGTLGAGGGAGGLSGDPGADGACNEPSTCTPDGGGGGATSGAGGAAGLPGGTSGSLGLGGAGGTDTRDTGFPCSFGSGGGGGGGGRFGGGGGRSGVGTCRGPFYAPGGGGGGSSLIAASALCSSPVETGVRSGDGFLRVTFPASPC